MNKIIQIDISKHTFDVAFQEKEKWNHEVFENNVSGFKKFIKSYRILRIGAGNQ